MFKVSENGVYRWVDTHYIDDLSWEIISKRMSYASAGMSWNHCHDDLPYKFKLGDKPKKGTTKWVNSGRLIQKMHILWVLNKVIFIYRLTSGFSLGGCILYVVG